MNTYSCIIVDDEPVARDIIIKYCTHLPYLHIAAICENAIEAKSLLQEHPVDILFLDIHLPVLDGISLLNVLRNPPRIIFTTAYIDYAVKAFDLNASDYLVKPFSLDRFIVAVDKAIAGINTSDKTYIQSIKSKGEEIFIKADGKIYKINFDDLVLAEAKGNYTKIVTSNQVITPSITFTSFEKMLPPDLFIRVHRSFIINKSKIDHIEGSRLFINKTWISIGKSYKESFLKSLGL